MFESIEKIYLQPLRQKYYPHDLGRVCYPYTPWKQYHHSAEINNPERPWQQNFKIQNGSEEEEQVKLSGISLTLLNESSSTVSEKQLTRSRENRYEVHRSDHIISTSNTDHLCLSFFQSKAKGEKPDHDSVGLTRTTHHENLPRNTLVYLHTHNGSKLEGLHLIEPILSMGLNLCLFDFSAYGNSKGKYSTLGVNETDDLEAVLHFLQQEYHQLGFFLVGRSMGAVTALLYLSQTQRHSKRHNIIGAVYDSPFSSLQKLTSELLAKKLKVHQTLVQPMVFLVKNTLKSKLDFKDLELTEKVRAVETQGMFLASKTDELIDCSHSQELYEKYKGKKSLVYIEQNHNMPRKSESLTFMYDFIHEISRKNNHKSKIVLQNIKRFQAKKSESEKQHMKHLRKMKT